MYEHMLLHPAWNSAASPHIYMIPALSWSASRILNFTYKYAASSSRLLKKYHITLDKQLGNHVQTHLLIHFKGDILWDLSVKEFLIQLMCSLFIQSNAAF